MKRITLLLIAAFVSFIAIAQDINDGLRYSTDATTGSARYSALSGAFGALGGDLSALHVNPAGGAVFLSSSGAITLAVDDVQNVASYFGTKNKSIETDITINQAGVVFVFNNPAEKAKWKKFTIGASYQTTKNFDNELFIKGTGNTSIGEFFLAQAQGIPLDLLQLQGGESISDLYAYLGENRGTGAQNAFLGYQGYIIDPVNPDDIQNTAYISNIGSGTFEHDYAYLTNGSNDKFIINLASQVSDELYFGININTHYINYNRTSFLFEANSNEGSTVDQVGFENNLSVRGTGFSGQLGAIAKIQNDFRLGLSLNSPSWYYMTEETTQYLETRRIENEESIYTKVDPRVLNIFKGYYIRTPAKVTASAAYIFGTQGLISFDYSFEDYKSIKLSDYDNDPYFNAVNRNIKNTLKGSSSFRLGAEYRINQVSLRGGLRYQESPYKNKDFMDDLNGFSLGLGYNFGNYNFDLSYARAEQKRMQQLYSIGLTDSATIKTISSNIAFTLGFKF